MRSVRKFINRSFGSYLVVGGITALIYFGIIALSEEFLGIDYRIGVSIAYIAAVMFHFFANRKFTFSCVDGRLIHQGVRYLGVLLLNYVVTLGVVSFFVDTLGGVTYLGALFAIGITVIIGYFALKFWIFEKRGGGL
jgi:putative flippase GtrA